MDYLRRQRISGWLAVGLSTALACFWALWGIIENFHEGWFYESFYSNLGLMFVQYLSPVLIVVALSMLSLHFPRVGSVTFAALGLLLPVFLKQLTLPMALLITTPLVLLGGLYWSGRARPRKVASVVIVGLPLLTIIVCGVGPALRVAGRVDDGNLQARLVEGNGVRLIWASDGEGWPREGVNWHEAVNRCQYLEGDGRTLADIPQNIWRLPTVEEAVRSMARHGVNSGGVWNSLDGTASYQTTPDKESPLWNIHSQVIYWWTATEVDEGRSYIIVYDGKVWPRQKQIRPAYLGFRCVKSPLSR